MRTASSGRQRPGAHSHPQPPGMRGQRGNTEKELERASHTVTSWGLPPSFPQWKPGANIPAVKGGLGSGPWLTPSATLCICREHQPILRWSGPCQGDTDEQDTQGLQGAIMKPGHRTSVKIIITHKIISGWFFPRTY